ncbi:hypothetical protein E4U58_002953 [Claviceps cyperi]|nr:hypothetical protein E4U58_002953 [Claviceps cyperi]
MGTSSATRDLAVGRRPGFTAIVEKLQRRALPILDRQNHQDWLRRVRIAIGSKDVAIAIESTKHKYAWIPREGGTIQRPRMT